MGLSERQQAVQAAAAELDRHRAELQQHIHGFREAGAQLLTPGRLIVGGLLVGFTSERLHERHENAAQDAARLRETECVAVAPAPPPPPDIIELVVRGLRLASAAMPLLMPLIARHTAEQAADQAAENVRDDVEHAVN